MFFATCDPSFTPKSRWTCAILRAGACHRETLQDVEFHVRDSGFFPCPYVVCGSASASSRFLPHSWCLRNSWKTCFLSCIHVVLKNLPVLNDKQYFHSKFWFVLHFNYINNSGQSLQKATETCSSIWKLG